MAISYMYDFGKQLDLAKVKGKLKMSSIDGDKNLLFLFMDPLFLVLFRDGRLRVIHKTRDLAALRGALTTTAQRFRSAVADIVKCSGVRKSVDSIISEGDVESRKGPLDVLNRPGLSGAGLATFRELSIFSPEKVLGEYQRERISTQAGETMGRGLAARAKDRKDLEEKLLDFIKEEGLGIASIMPLEKAEKITNEMQKPYALFRVFDSTSYGIVPDGKPMCDLIRGLIRGVYCAYLNQENVNVVETRCWGLGDVYCEFRVYLTKM